ncbi:MAG: ABC transporter substrate-binding protein [Syntrophobacteraceae bacterium]
MTDSGTFLKYGKIPAGRTRGPRSAIGFPGAVLLAILFAFHAEAREIVDMAGRTVRVPDRITRVYCASPPATYLLYALDTSLLAGLNYPFTGKHARYLRPEFNSLPVLGGWFGQGKTPNMESLLAIGPDLMIDWMWKIRERTAVKEKVEAAARTMNLPVVYMQSDGLEQYPEAILFMGKLLDREERARALSDYGKEILPRVGAAVSSIPEDRKVTVYYAEGRDGLATECDSSYHAELINLAGGRNIHRCEPKDLMGMEKIPLEQVILSDPQVILVKEEAFFDCIFSDSRWQNISAVRNGRVHLIPSLPFNWFDRPPSFMRFLGLQWLTRVLYPQRYPVDMALETRRFYKLFFDMDLSDGQLKEILGL